MDPVPTLIKIADYFNTSTDYILGRTYINKPVDKINETIDGRDMDLINLYHKLSSGNKNVVDGFILGLASKEDKNKKN